MIFADILKQLRKEHGVSQIALAKSIGTTDRNLRRYEKNEIEPPLSMIMAIADYFNVSSDYLIGRCDDPTPPLLVRTTLTTSNPAAEIQSTIPTMLTECAVKPRALALGI
jgi:transcriptional regulator with XRE-family HTH domain